MKNKQDSLIELCTYTSEDSNVEFDRFKIREIDLCKILSLHFDDMDLEDFLEEYTFDDSQLILEISKDENIKIYQDETI